MNREPSQTNERMLQNEQYEQVRIGKLGIVPLFQEHQQENIPHMQKQLLYHCARHPDMKGVILEYSPTDIRTRQDDVDASERWEYNEYHNEIIPYFGAAEQTIPKHLSLLVLDPAHGQAYANLQLAEMSVLPALNGIAATTSLVNMYKATRRIGQSSRRQFITKVAINGALLLTAIDGIQGTLSNILASSSESLPTSPLPSYTDLVKFRRASVAKGILNMANDLNSDPKRPPETYALMYPPAHGKEILDNLQNPAAVNMECAMFEPLNAGNNRIFGPLFSRRTYNWDGRKWAKSSEHTF